MGEDKASEPGNLRMMFRWHPEAGESAFEMKKPYDVQYLDVAGFHHHGLSYRRK